MSTLNCACGKPTAGTVLCDRCTTTLTHTLANVPAYYGGLDTVATKRTRFSSGPATKGSIGKSQPLPVDLRFAGRTKPGTKLRTETETTLRTWAILVRTEQPQIVGPICGEPCLHRSCHQTRFRRPGPGRTVRDHAGFINLHQRHVISQDYANTMLSQLVSLEKRLCRFVDRPPDRWYAGKCSQTDDDTGARCEAELYATAETGKLHCPTCGTEHDVAKRRDFLLAEAKDYLVTATEAAGALMAWTDYDGSEDRLVDRIRKWATRDRLEVRGHVEVAGRDRGLYRLGDVQDLMVDDARTTNTRRIGAA